MRPEPLVEVRPRAERLRLATPLRVAALLADRCGAGHRRGSRAYEAPRTSINRAVESPIAAISGPRCAGAGGVRRLGRRRGGGELIVGMPRVARAAAAVSSVSVASPRSRRVARSRSRRARWFELRVEQGPPRSPSASARRARQRARRPEVGADRTRRRRPTISRVRRTVRAAASAPRRALPAVARSAALDRAPRRRRRGAEPDVVRGAKATSDRRRGAPRRRTGDAARTASFGARRPARSLVEGTSYDAHRPREDARRGEARVAAAEAASRAVERRAGASPRQRARGDAPRARGRRAGVLRRSSRARRGPRARRTSDRRLAGASTAGAAPGTARATALSCGRARREARRARASVVRRRAMTPLGRREPRADESTGGAAGRRACARARRRGGPAARAAAADAPPRAAAARRRRAAREARRTPGRRASATRRRPTLRQSRRRRERVAPRAPGAAVRPAPSPRSPRRGARRARAGARRRRWPWAAGGAPVALVSAGRSRARRPRHGRAAVRGRRRGRRPVDRQAPQDRAAGVLGMLRADERRRRARPVVSTRQAHGFVPTLRVRASAGRRSRRPIGADCRADHARGDARRRCSASTAARSFRAGLGAPTPRARRSAPSPPTPPRPTILRATRASQHARCGSRA